MYDFEKQITKRILDKLHNIISILGNSDDNSFNNYQIYKY